MRRKASISAALSTVFLAAALVNGGPAGIPSAWASGDAFDTANQEARAGGYPGVSLHLSLAGTATIFHMGEPIPVTLSFTGSAPGKYQLISGYLSTLDEFHVDRAADVARPILDLPIRGESTMGAVPINEKPSDVHAVVNTWYRFDKPGHYRVYVVSDRVEPDPLPAVEVEPAPRSASDVIEFDILPDDPVWDRAQFVAARKDIDAEDENMRRHARMTYAYLGTEDVIRDVARRLCGAPVWDDGLADILYSARRRAFAVETLKDELHKPDAAVTGRLLEAMARLELTGRYPLPGGDTPGAESTGVLRLEREWRIKAQEPALIAAYCRSLQDAIGLKRGRARAVSIVALLGEDAKVRRGNKARTASEQRLAASLYPILGSLTAAQQRDLLVDPAYNAIKGPKLVPYLKRVVRIDAQINGDCDQYDLREAAVHRLYEISPSAGRQAILDNITSAKMDMDFGTLTMLPDREIPALDPVLKRNLLKADGAEMAACLMIARYASPALLSDAETWCRQMIADPDHSDPDALDYLIAYVLRVDDRRGAPLLRKAIAQRTKRSANAAILSGIIPSLHTPQFERVLRAHVTDPDPAVAGDARRALDLLPLYRNFTWLQSQRRNPGNAVSGADMGETANVDTSLVVIDTPPPAEMKTGKPR